MVPYHLLTLKDESCRRRMLELQPLPRHHRFCVQKLVDCGIHRQFLRCWNFRNEEPNGSTESCAALHMIQDIRPGVSKQLRSNERDRDASRCIRRHQTSALAPVRGRRIPAPV